MQASQNQSQSARCRALLIEAEAVLKQKKAEYRHQRRIRQHLKAKVDLLEVLEGRVRIQPSAVGSLMNTSADSSDSDVSSAFSVAGTMLHDLAMRTIGARMVRRPSDVPTGLELSQWSTAFESLPLSLDLYNEELLIRTAEMNVGDEVHIYKGFLNR